MVSNGAINQANERKGRNEGKRHGQSYSLRRGHAGEGETNRGHRLQPLLSRGGGIIGGEEEEEEKERED